MSIKKTRTDIILDKIKNNKIFAVLIVVGIIIGVFAAFSESLLKLISFKKGVINNREPTQKISTFQPSNEYKHSKFENYFNSNFEIAEYENEIITVSKGDLVVNFSVLSNNTTFSYKIKKEENIIKINPQSDYLSLLQKGGPIYPLNKIGPLFEFQFPNLDIKIVNNTDNTIYLTQAIFDIHESKVDLFPILIIRGVGDRMNLPLRNIGWGKVYDCIIRFNIFPTNEKVITKNTYNHEIIIGEFESYSERTNLTPIFKELGVDVETLKKGYGDAPRDYKRALGIFKDGRARVIGEIHYSGLNPSGVKSKEKLKFEAIVSLGLPMLGAALGPTFLYDVMLETDKSNYKKILPLSQVIKSNDADRFNIKISAIKSSRHVFDLILLYNENNTIKIPNIAFNYFMSTQDAHSIRNKSQSEKDINR